MEVPVCDHHSVGIIARDGENRILMARRKGPPIGIAPPSGHLDGLTYPMACLREFEEETGLRVVEAPHPLVLKNSYKEFECYRGGKYHFWQIFEVSWEGQLHPNQDKILRVGWYSPEEIRKLTEITRIYLDLKRALPNLGLMTATDVEEEWGFNPGLESIWCEFFKELKII